MFQKSEIEQLRLRKEQLIAQSAIYRARLAADWKRLQSPGRWRDEALGFLKRHPVGTTTLAAAGGTLAYKLFRHPRKIIGGIGKLASTAISAWKLFKGKK